MITRGKNVIAVPPGETIKEFLEDNSMSAEDFAEKMGLPGDSAARLLDGSLGINDDIAKQLEKVFGAPAEMWSSLEAEYSKNLRMIKRERILRMRARG